MRNFNIFISNWRTLPYLVNVRGRLLFSEKISRVDALIRWWTLLLDFSGKIPGWTFIPMWTLINFWQNAKCNAMSPHAFFKLFLYFFTIYYVVVVVVVVV